MKNLTYKYYNKQASRTVCLILHGAAAGIESSFISQLYTSLSNGSQSVFTFNFPYLERGKTSPSPNLREEIEALAFVIDSLKEKGYEVVILIAKSLGAVIASYYLKENPTADVRVAVLGYVVGEVQTAALIPKLKLVVQGQRDRFGNALDVRNELTSDSIKVIEIPAADHSYRNIAREPEYQMRAIELLLEDIKSW